MPNSQDVRLPSVVADRLIQVPDYQRPYAWGEKQLADLWEDLDLLGSAGTHYAGTLVLRDIETAAGVPMTSMDDAGTTLRHCEVVDGQQRLTTCVLLLDRVRRRLDALADAGVESADLVARNIRQRYGFVQIGKVPTPRLKLGAELNSYWVSVILGDEDHVGPSLIAGERRLRDAAAFFDAQLDRLGAGASPDEDFIRLKDLQRRVTDGLGFLVYEVGSVGEVGVIFETLNERGRQLTDLEKAKNYLLYLARNLPDGRSEQLAEEINSDWAAIFRNLSKEAGDLDDLLLRPHWLATQNPDSSAYKGIGSVKQRFDRSKYLASHNRLRPAENEHDQDAAWDQLYEDVSTYVKSLVKCSYFLAEMFDPDADFEAFGADERAKVRARSAALRRSGVVAQYRPLLFASRLTRPSDGDFYARLVDLCERFSARVFIIEQRNSSAGRSRLFRFARDLFSGTDPDDVLAEMHWMLWEFAPNDRVRATLEDTSLNWYRRHGHKYFLYEYERSLLGSDQEEMPPLATFIEAKRQERTTEHILPQTPDDDADCWWSRFTWEEYETLNNSLGNLMLTLDNSSYYNHCYDKKRGVPLAPGQPRVACYAQGKLHQERLLASTYDEWTPDTIRHRQQALADWAMQRWAMEPPDGSTVVIEPETIEYEGTDDDVVSLSEEPVV